MKLKHLEIFHAVMLTGTISGAARLLHLTQPAATQALQLARGKFPGIGAVQLQRTCCRLQGTGQGVQ